MANILLFGGGLQILSVARSLSKNHSVDVCGEHVRIASKSRFVGKCHKIKLEQLSPKEFCRIVNLNNYSVIIPTEDEFAEWLSENKPAVENETKAVCAVNDIVTLKKAIDKYSLLTICADNNIPCPRTASIASEKDIDSASAYVGFPALLKPNISNGSRGIQRVDSMNELTVTVQNSIRDYGDCSLQEFIDNPNHYYNVMLYRTKDGKWANHTVTKITRFYPIKGGSSSFCTSIENTDILEPCKKLLEVLNWHGFADFDVLEKAPGDYRIIELNPRVPASVHAAAISGVSFGDIIVNDCLNLSIPSYEYTPGKHLRYLGLDIAWFLASPNRFKCRPSWFSFFGKNLDYQEGGLSDPIAMIVSIMEGIRKQLSPSFRKAKSGMN